MLDSMRLTQQIYINYYKCCQMALLAKQQTKLHWNLLIIKNKYLNNNLVILSFELSWQTSLSCTCNTESQAALLLFLNVFISLSFQVVEAAAGDGGRRDDAQWADPAHLLRAQRPPPRTADHQHRRMHHGEARTFTMTITRNTVTGQHPAKHY